LKDETKTLFQNNITLINIIDKIIFYFRTQNYDKALRDSTVFIDQLNSNMELLENIAGGERIAELSAILENILLAQDSRDYVILADFYELQMLRFFIGLQEDIMTSSNIEMNDTSDTYLSKNLVIIKKHNSSIEKLIDEGEAAKNLLIKGYEIEFSSCGLPTLALADNRGKYYLHSNSRVSEVAFTLAASWYEENILHYVIYGLGLGYHVKELVRLDDSITVEIYEADINVIKLAAVYTDMESYIQSPNVKLIYDPDYTKLMIQLNLMQKGSKFLIHYPSLRNIRNVAVREQLENYFLQYSSIENQRKLLNANFRENIHHYDGLIDELKNKFQEKDLFIVAAGPSLDKNFLQLKNIDRKKGIILATGTVVRKLLNAGIIPDYVIVTDANERVYGQIAGLENSSFPLLYLSTANKSFAQNYKGKKFLILQHDYDKSEAFAKENNTMLFQTGGSVSTTALDIGISFGCKRIIFLGLDLAYTDNYVHASNTSQRILNSTEDLRQVVDINGKLIYTSKSLDIYRQWIENRIRNVKKIEFVDATEGGARIAGMKIRKLSECITG
jgi:hypothetical protein